MSQAQTIKELSDRELTSKVKEYVRSERETLAELLEHLAEFDQRKVALVIGFPSLYEYCTRELKYSEGAAYRRIHASRAASRYPIIYQKIASGELHLSGVTTLAPYLTSDNHRELLDLARGKTRRELEFMLVRLAPRHVPKDTIRRVFPQSHGDSGASSGSWHASASAGSTGQSGQPQPPWHPAADPARGAPAEVILPLTPECVRFSFVGAPALLDLLERSREVLRHKYPTGKIEDIFREALEMLLDKKDPERMLKRQDEKAAKEQAAAEAAEKAAAAPTPAKEAPVTAPSVLLTPTRYIPKSVREQVLRRDRSSCAWIGSSGRCGKKDGIQIDHIVPWSIGGRSDTPGNLRVLCRAHNLLAGQQEFGDHRRTNNTSDKKNGGDKNGYNKENGSKTSDG